MTVQNVSIEAESTASEAGSRSTSAFDIERPFSIGLGEARLLNREEEDTLARQVVTARNRIRRMLRKNRTLTAAALADRSRGVVKPEEDFREQETMAILRYGRRALTQPRPAKTTGLRKVALAAFVSDLTAALADYRVLRNQMLGANLRLVAMMARKFRGSTLTFPDLVQEGSIGLIRAIEKYDPNRDVKFGTYATWWIWQRMSRALDTDGDLIRTPVYWNQFRRRLFRETRKDGEQRGSPSADSATRCKTDEPHLKRMSQAFRYVSTATPLGDEGEDTLESLLRSDGAQPDGLALHDDLRRHLEQAIGQLPAREREIIQRRFDLDADDPETLNEIGSRFRISRERVRQLESRALRQLRDICELQGLQEYLH